MPLETSEIVTPPAPGFPSAKPGQASQLADRAITELDRTIKPEKKRRKRKRPASVRRKK